MLAPKLFSENAKAVRRSSQRYALGLERAFRSRLSPAAMGASALLSEVAETRTVMARNRTHLALEE